LGIQSIQQVLYRLKIGNVAGYDARRRRRECNPGAPRICGGMVFRLDDAGAAALADVG
jgi:hypothetical protein